MKILVLHGSNRPEGRHRELSELPINYTRHIDHYYFYDKVIKPCQDCRACMTRGQCILVDDMANLVHKMTMTDCLIYLIPVYAPMPSKMSAFYERMITWSYHGGVKPLRGKKVAIIYYGSSGIQDPNFIKMMTQQLYTDSYDFKKVTYDFIDLYQEKMTLEALYIKTINSIGGPHVL